MAKREGVQETVQEDSVSVIAGAIPAGTVSEIDPDLILIDKTISNLRIRNPKADDEFIRFACTIFEEGQRYPGLARLTPDGVSLIAGERRLRAIKYLKSEEGQRELDMGEEDIAKAAEMAYRVEILEDVDDARALRLAKIENIQRKEFTPIELANMFKADRKMLEIGQDAAGTKELADYYGVSPATITQHLRLLTLDQDIQTEVQLGNKSMSAALELASVKPEKREEVGKVAQEKADKERDKKEAERAEKEAQKEEAKEAAESNGKSAKGAKKEREHNPNPKVPVFKPGQTKPNAPSAPAKVERKHVTAAAKEVEGAVDKIKAPKMSELIELLEMWNSPAAYQKSVLKFVGMLLAWTHGGVADKKVTAALDDLSELLPGDVEKEEKAEVKKPEVKKPEVKKPEVKKPTPPSKSSAKTKQVVKKPTPKPATKPTSKPAPKPTAKPKK